MEDIEYDYIIVGSGPSGLALAQCLSSIGQKVLIVERESSIGGCHRVKRVEYNGEKLFTEHGPRIYSSAYRNTMMILDKMNKKFEDVFTPYLFNIATIGNETVFTTLTLYEAFIIIIYYVPFLLNPQYGVDISMENFMKSNNFSKETSDIIDRICRITDGADISRYTLNEFYNLFNQNFFYRLYQPKLPNDVGLLKSWNEHLIENGVAIALDTEVVNLNYNSLENSIRSITVKNDDLTYNISAKNIILAVPPMNMIKILNDNSISLLENEAVKNSFGNFKEIEQWSKDTEYIDYISITFHWDKKLEIPKKYGFSKTSWGLIYIVLTDYMQFNENSSHTVISVAVSNGDLKSDRINKTANECFDKNELIEEVFDQLRQSIPELQDYTTAIISPNTVYSENKWINLDMAYVSSSINPKTIPFRSKIENLYTVGTHTGKTFYKFTSMESAITNSIHLAHELHPELRTKFPLTRGLEVNTFIRLFLISIIFLILYFVLK